MISNNIPKRYPKHIQKISEFMDIFGYLWISLDILGYPNAANSQMTRNSAKNISFKAELCRGLGCLETAYRHGDQSRHCHSVTPYSGQSRA